MRVKLINKGLERMREKEKRKIVGNNELKKKKRQKKGAVEIVNEEVKINKNEKKIN